MTDADVEERGREQVAIFGAFLGEVQAVRRLGSAALNLCYVAAGRFDGYWETKIHPWDVAAGAVQTAVVEPVDVLQSGELDVVEAPPGPRRRMSSVLVRAPNEGLGGGVVVGVALAAD